MNDIEKILPTRESIRKIIELTAHEYDGDVWGDDTILGTMDELIDAAIEILRNERLYYLCLIFYNIYFHL